MSEWLTKVRARAILASAGSGKTFQLANQYIALLCAGVPADRILATTFTRKAAGEILDRVLARLGAAAQSEKAAIELGAFIGLPGLGVADARRVLVQFVRALHTASIGTLDAFFAKLAAAFELDIGLPPGWSIAAEEVHTALVFEGVERLIARAEPREMTQLLRSLHKGGFPAAVAGAVARVVRESSAMAKRTGAHAWSCVPALMQRKLSSEALSLAIRELEAAPAMGEGSGKEDGNFVKAKRKILEAALSQDWLTVATSTFGRASRVSGKKYGQKALSASLVAALAPIVEHAEHEVLRQARDENEAARSLADRFALEYQRLTLERSLFGFADIPDFLLSSGATGTLDQLFYRLDSRIDHVLLDEFQDTSLTQFAILRPILEEILGGGEGATLEREATAAAGRSVFLVGDVKQSLYAWRDAEPDLFGEVLKLWPQLQRDELHQSRRSSKVVLDAVNTVFSTLGQNPALSKDGDDDTGRAWSDAFPLHSTAVERGGSVRVHVVERNPDAEVPILARLRFAAHRVRDLVASAPRASVGILLATNAHAARLIHELKELGVAASEEGGNPLTDSPAVAAVLSALQIVDHPSDSAARFHLATTALGEALQMQSWRSAELASNFSAVTRQSIARVGISEVIRDWQRLIAHLCGRRDGERLTQLVELAQEHDPQRGPRLRDFIELASTRKVESARPELVRVMTIHKSKGLEFDAVVLPQLDISLLRADGLVARRRGVLDPFDAVSNYPNKDLRAIDVDLDALYRETRARALRERICVLYVAMTRARHALEVILDAEQSGTSPTYAQILRGAFRLADDVHGLAYAKGDDAWMSAFGFPTHSSERATSPIQVRWKSLAAIPTSRLQQISPSSLQVPQTKPMSSHDTQPTAFLGTRLGRVVHALFEQIEWLQPDTAASIHAHARLLVSNTVEQDELQTLIENSLSDLDFRSVLSTERYACWSADSLLLKREVRLGARISNAAVGDALVVGIVDRLVVGVRDGSPITAEVIDFKTDRVPSSSVDELVKIYAPQLNAYRSVVAAQLRVPLPSVRGTLAFTAARRVVSWE